jgi:hypothetical protein
MSAVAVIGAFGATVPPTGIIEIDVISHAHTDPASTDNRSTGRAMRSIPLTRTIQVSQQTGGNKHCDLSLYRKFFAAFSQIQNFCKSQRQEQKSLKTPGTVPGFGLSDG